MSLRDDLPEHDRRVMAAFVANALTQHALPDWQKAWAMLTDIGRHKLAKAEPAEVFATALDAWSEAPRRMPERLLRKGMKSTLRKKYGAEAAREIQRAQVKYNGERAVEQSA